MDTIIEAGKSRIRKADNDSKVRGCFAAVYIEGLSTGSRQIRWQIREELG